MTDFSSKERLRTYMIQKRLALTTSAVEVASRKVFKNVFDTLAGMKVDKVMAFMPFRNEIDVTYIIEELLKRNIDIILPRVDKITNTLNIFKVTNLVEQLEEGSWGIKEPFNYLPKATHQEIDLVIVPGVAFDKKCFRLGYGGGFYDRFLQDFQGKTIGVAYDFQIVQQVPVDSWDIPLDLVITEEACYRSP